MNTTGNKIAIALLIILLSVSFCAVTFPAKAQDEVVIGMSPTELEVNEGELFNVTIYMQNMPQSANLIGVEFRVYWNASVLNGTALTEVLYATNTPEGEEDNIWKLKKVVAADHIEYAYTYMDTSRAITGGYAPIYGNHTVAIITLNASSPVGLTDLVFTKILLGNADGDPIINYVIGRSTISVGNPPPEITLLSPQNVTYAQNVVNLTMRLSEATSWIGYSLDGQANRTVSGNITMPQEILTDGAHSLTVYANDTSGEMGSSETRYFTVDATSPVAYFTYSPGDLQGRMIFGTYKWEIKFNASGSYDAVTSIVSYAWSFGDGFNGSGAFLNHTFREAGVFNVTLTVKDRVNHTGAYSMTFTFVEPPPEPLPETTLWWMVAVVVLPAVWVPTLVFVARKKRKELKQKLIRR